jgi:threonylcarbamoyladenosine tRNA methylthiotransferase MtaB
MPGQHPNAVKEARSRRAVQVAEEMSRQYGQGLIGTVQQVLFEEPEGQYYTGHAPNYVKFYVRGEGLHNEVWSVRVTEVYKDGVRGEIVAFP